MASWRYKPPGPHQVATVLTRDDGRVIVVFNFTLEYLDHHGWHVRIHERAETLFMRWRFRQ